MHILERRKGHQGIIRGDDLTLLGYETQLDWFREKIMDKFEVKLQDRELSRYTYK